MALSSLTNIFISILIPVLATGATAMQSAPTDLPSDRVALGNARVNAWRSLRLDLDTLNHGDSHPALVHLWLDDAPPSVLRHIARHAMDPTLVLSALGRLAKDPATESDLFKELAQKWHDSPRLPFFLALRVIANDRDYSRMLEQKMKSPSDTIRFNAAAILAIAGNSDARELLTREVATCGAQIDAALRILTPIGAESDRRIIEKAISAGCRKEQLQRASGEIILKSRYPLYHSRLVRRDPSDTRFQVGDGMYASWFELLRFAETQRITSIEALLPWLRQFRQFSDVWPNRSPEVSRRNVDAFSDFMELVAQHIHTYSPKAPWPKSWQEALANLQDDTSQGFDARVSAAIAILDWTESIEPATKLFAGDAFAILSPRGDRSIDGNWRSSWQGKKGASLTAAFYSPRTVSTLWLATGCVNEVSSGLKQVLVTVAHGNTQTVKKISLNPSALFFQPVPINKNDVNSLKVEVVRTAGRTPACITELKIAN